MYAEHAGDTFVPGLVLQVTFGRTTPGQLQRKCTLLVFFAERWTNISNLPFLSKFIEKAALFQLNGHASNNNVLPTNQSAYRQFHSCETALLRLVNDILEGIEQQEVTALIALDLSAAFDTVDHSILLKVLACVVARIRGLPRTGVRGSIWPDLSGSLPLCVFQARNKRAD